MATTPLRTSTASGAEMLAENADPSVPSTSKARLHLPYLDGIRALMALYIMHVHLLLALGVKADPPHLSFSELLMPFFQGHDAVVVFIVLSGYCLMLPVVRDGGTLRGGIATFFKRRARRILPPYYAALFSSALVTVAIAYLTHLFPLPVEITSPKRWLLHLLLLHNLSWQHIYEYTPPLWSIATEWQIYFFFPLVFLPVWRKWNNGALIGVAAITGLTLTVLFPSIALACPWFVFLFALGMLAAKWSLHPSPSLRKIPWMTIALALTLLTYLALRFVPAVQWVWPDRHGRLGLFPLPDISFGVAMLCFLMHGTLATLEERPSKFVRAFTWRPLVFLGSFSYSFYLIHETLQSVALQLFHPFHLPPLQLYGIMMILYVPLAIALAYVFYLVFEKPFLGTRQTLKRGV
ncbi:hypothetical protein IAD21_05872 [Abditibacteriota bacterium]|nr:hypothetical protein IAD21_05872 [Abditibacteriota bacterium]